MKLLLSFSLSLALLARSVVAADSPAPVPAPAVDPMAEVLPLLQAKYTGFASLLYKEGDHLGDLVARSNGGIELDPVSSGSMPILTATLPNGVIYGRFATFTPKKDWNSIADDLRQPAIRGAVLDLRSNTSPNDYAGAAQVAAYFAPAATTLLPYIASKDVTGPATYLFPGPVIVLINGQTTGAAAALAACLKTNGALLVGQPTTVTAAFFEEHTFANGQVLRFATAPPAGLPATVMTVIPDIAMTVDGRNEKMALSLIRDNHVLDVIEESAERHRMSEASLVQGQDPEWDQYLSSLEQGPVLLSLPHIHDPVLVTALDSLRAIRFAQGPPPAQTTANASTPAPSSL